MAILYQRPASEIAALRGNKVPFPHRVRLADGTSLIGEIHRATTTRLADHMTSVEEFLALTNVAFEGSTQRRDFLLVNTRYIVYLEELRTDGERGDTFSLPPESGFAVIDE